MGTEALKSASITNLDATPVVANTEGEGSNARIRQVNDYVTTTSGVLSGSTYKFVRVPTTAKIKSIKIENAAMTGGTMDIGLYYSSSTVDGTAAVNQGTYLNKSFFASNDSMASAQTPTEIVNQSGQYTVDRRNLPLWHAAYLSADPGGFFDIVGSLTSTIAVGALVSLSVEYA